MYNSSDKDKDSVVTLFFDCSVVRMWDNGSEGHLFKSHNCQAGPSARPLTFSCIKQDIYKSLWIGDTLDFCQNVHTLQNQASLLFHPISSREQRFPFFISKNTGVNMYAHHCLVV